METQQQVSLQIFLQHLFFLPSITFTHPGDCLHGGGHCIPMSYKSSLESSCSNVQLIVVYTLPCFDICFLAYSYNQAVMLALNHGISRLLAHIFLLPLECSESCTLSQKDLNFLLNLQMSLVNPWRAALQSPRSTPDYCARGTTMSAASNGRDTHHVLT